MQQLVIRSEKYPPVVKRSFQKLLIKWGEIYRNDNRRPSFLIIGAQKGGTSSLYNYLIQHPNVKPAYKKEIHFFTIPNLYRKGIMWYKAHFPLCYVEDMQCGESSPSYLYFPQVPRKVYEAFPNIKIIVLLRNPITRAFSNYHHQVRRGIETLSFEQAVFSEERRLQGEVEKMLQDSDYLSFNFSHFGYLSRGIYYQQLQRWYTYFPKNQMYVLKSEDFYQNPMGSLKQVISFLELPPWKPNSEVFKAYNDGSYAKMDDKMKVYLRNFFSLHNEKLNEFLDQEITWDEN